MIRLYADSTNDLGQELIERYHVRIVPLYVTLGEKTGKDGVDIMPGDIYDWSEANKSTPKTAAFSPMDAAEALKEAKEAGDEVLFIGISMDFSTVCNSVRLGADEIDYEEHVHIVDSRNLSTGIGLVIMEAGRMIEEGAPVEEIVAHLEDVIPRVRASFILDTLTYLARGGRCSTVTALLAGTLKIKPKVVVEDGKMHVTEKYRGKLGPVLMKYARDMEEQLLNAETENVFITSSNAMPEEIKALREYLESLGHFRNIYETFSGGIISSHCGPNCLGILFISKG